MAENLNLDTNEGCWCYEYDRSNCQKYGRLYSWEAAKKSCQEVGWRLPTDEEWSNLKDFYWGSEKAYESLKEGGDSGFNALLGGYRNQNGTFFSLANYGNYWSSTENGKEEAWRYKFYSSYREILRHPGNKSQGHFLPMCEKIN